MPPSTYTSLIFLLQHVFSLLSLPINTFLIILIITKSPPQLGAYKYLMIFISLFEMAYSVLDMVLGPLNMTAGSSFSIVIPIRKSYLLSKSTLKVLNACYWGFFGSSLAVFAIHFFYRYLAVKGSELIETFNSWKIMFLFVPTVISTSVWMLIAWFIGEADETMTRFISQGVFDNFGLKPNEFDYLGLYIYRINPEDSSISPRLSDLLGLILCSFIVSSSLITVIYFGWKCYQSLSTLINSSMSSQSYSKLQSQLFYALVIQTSIPLAFLIFPASLCIIFTIFDSKLQFLNGIVSISIAFYPVIDPLPTIFIVKSYRNAVFELFKCSSCVGNNRIYSMNSSNMQNNNSNSNKIDPTVTHTNNTNSVNFGVTC